MPFTFSHPAIVLPLKKIYPALFSVSGLVVGSLIPDFEYFMAFSGTYDFGHSIAGIFLLDIPLGFCVTILFHLLIRDILIAYLPAPFDKRYSGFMDFHFYTYLKKNWLVYFTSLLIGIVSHLMWDNLATPEAYFSLYDLAPDLFAKPVQIAGKLLPLYEWMDLISSGLGLLFVIWTLLRINEPLDDYVPPALVYRILYWVLWLAGTWLLFTREQNKNPQAWSDSLPHQLVVLISAGIVSIVAITVGFKIVSDSLKNKNLFSKE